MHSKELQEIEKYILRRRRPEPARAALLVIDMQAYFYALAQPVLNNVLSLVQACKKNNMQIIYTRHGHRDISRNGGMLLQWWGQSVQHGTADWELIQQLPVESQDLVLDKNRYSAFQGTDLATRLQASSIDELIITGVLTNCCCETTARDAFVRDYRVFFISDATATVNLDLHLSSLKNLAFGFAYLLSTQELLQYL